MSITVEITGTEPLTIRYDGGSLISDVIPTRNILRFSISGTTNTQFLAAATTTSFKQLVDPIDNNTCYKIINSSGVSVTIDATNSDDDMIYPKTLNNGEITWYYVDNTDFQTEFTDTPCCIYPNAKIETPSGLIKIKDIRSGDKVKDMNGKFINVIYNIKFMPCSKFVCIKKDTLAKNCPFEDLRATCGHPLFTNGREVTFEDIVNGNTIVKQKLNDEFVYALCTRERTYVMTSGVPVCTWEQNGWENNKESKRQKWFKL